MEFASWHALVTKKLRISYPELEIFERSPGICLVVGRSSLDLIDARNGNVQIAPLKDPIVIIDGIPQCRHMGMTLPRYTLALSEESVREAVRILDGHFRPARSAQEDA